MVKDKIDHFIVENKLNSPVPEEDAPDMPDMNAVAYHLLRYLILKKKILHPLSGQQVSAQVLIILNYRY